MALPDLTALDSHRKLGVFVATYPPDQRTFYAPYDDLHGVLVTLLQSVRQSLVIDMYGFDDAELATLVQGHLNNPAIYVQVNLDSTQYAGAHEQQVLATWRNDCLGNSVAIGRSERGAIAHRKTVVVDGLDVVTGSTNWSEGGEAKQANQLTVIRNPLVAHDARTVSDLLHTAMLKQMAAKPAASPATN